MNRPLIDSHTHIEYFLEQGTEPEIRRRAQETGLVHAINVGTGSKDWALYAKMAQTFSGFYSYTVGLHPCSVGEDWEKEIEIMQPFLRPYALPAPVAWGEMGLDYFHLPKGKEAAERNITLQKSAFRTQLKLVKEQSAPVVIHSREAFEDTVSILDESEIDWERVVFHCFTFGPEEMKILLDRGGRASFTGILTYPKTDAIREAFLLQGLDKLMIETDAPWLSPQPVRKHKNEPAYVLHVAEKAAELLDIPLKELAEQTTQNAVEFFGLDCTG